MARPQALLAERVIGRDFFDPDACETEQERGQEARPILPADAVDEDASRSCATARTPAAAFSRKRSRKIM